MEKLSTFINRQANKRNHLIYNKTKSLYKQLDKFDLQGKTKNQIKHEINWKIREKRVQEFRSTWKEFQPNTRYNHATTDGKFIMEAANPKIAAFSNRNSPLYGRNPKQAYKQLHDMLYDKTPRNRIIKALNKMIKSGWTDDHIKAQLKDLKKQIIDKSLPTVDIVKKLTNFDTSTEWYEEHKESLKDASEIRDRLLRKNKVRVNGASVERLNELGADTGAKWIQQDIDIIDSSMFNQGSSSLNVTAYREKRNALGSTVEDVMNNVLKK